MNVFSICRFVPASTNRPPGRGSSWLGRQCGRAPAGRPELRGNRRHNPRPQGASPGAEPYHAFHLQSTLKV